MIKMASEFVSRVDVFLKIKGNSRISCQLKRHLSPRTIGLITRSLPISGNIHNISKSILYIQTKINSGLERKKTDFKSGDIAYLPISGSICFYLDDVSNGQPMTPIGKLVSNFQMMRDLKSGDVLTIHSETA